MEIDDVTLRTLKSIELDMLSSFIRSCEQLGLRYYLMDGTLLGAVRHNGFIPWDDDIDVGMLREDYDIYIKHGQQHLPEHLFLQSSFSEPDFLFSFAKIRDSRTTFIEKSTMNRNINHGVYIDIFPIDFYPESKKEQKEIDIKRRINNIRIRREYTLPPENRMTLLQELIKATVGTILMLKYPSATNAVKANDTLFKHCIKSDYCVNYCGAYVYKSIVPADWFGDGVDGIFEGLSVKLPSQYQKYLESIYGDYMQLPPVEKRVSHHYTEVIDTDKPYTYYININK